MPDFFSPEHSMCFDRDGNPISLWGWVALMEEKGHEYQQVASDRLDDGHIWVSTVWLGIDHSFSARSRPPVIFETMVFVSCTEEQLEERRQWWGKERGERFPWEDLDGRRYCTEADARAGHREIVDSLRFSIDSLEGLQLE